MPGACKAGGDPDAKSVMGVRDQTIPASCTCAGNGVQQRQAIVKTGDPVDLASAAGAGAAPALHHRPFAEQIGQQRGDVATIRGRELHPPGRRHVQR